MASLLASAESMSIAVRTPGGRMMEYRTSLVGETDVSFSIYVAADLWDRLSPGDVVLIKASVPSGFLLFETRVLRMGEKPIAHADLAATDPGKVRRVPRREHFRVAASLPVTVTFERPGAKLPEQTVVVHAVTFDISTGGIGVLVDREREQVLPAPYAAVHVHLSLAAIGPQAGQPAVAILACEGRVVRIYEMAGTTAVRVGIDFRDMTEPQQVELSRFVMSHQLELRRRGVLF